MLVTGRISGSVAVVTGAGGGIGLGIARAAAAHGMRLVLTDIAAERLAAVSNELVAAGYEVLAVPTDMSDAAAADRLAKAVRERFGTIRLLVNNAAFETGQLTPALSTAQWERTLRINIMSQIHGVRAFARAMIEAGEPAFIANVASDGAPVPYIMSKQAILAFSESLSLKMAEVAPKISVSVVLPGTAATRSPTDRSVEADDAARTIFDQILAGRFRISATGDMPATSLKTRSAWHSNMSAPKDRRGFN